MMRLAALEACDEADDEEAAAARDDGEAAERDASTSGAESGAGKTATAPVCSWCTDGTTDEPNAYNDAMIYAQRQRNGTARGAAVNSAVKVWTRSVKRWASRHHPRLRAS